MYKFKKLDNNDEFLLMYDQGKSIKFKRTIKIAQRIQSIDSEARFSVFKKLSEMGYTMDNNPLVIIKKEGSKTIRDESNMNAFIEEEKKGISQQIMIEIMEDMFGMNLEELLTTLEIQDDKLAEKVFYELGYILKTGEVLGTKKTPSPNN